RYLRTGGAWNGQAVLFRESLYEKPTELPLPRSEWPLNAERPGAKFWRWHQRRSERDESLAEVARFFPSVPAHEQYQFAYPLPGSDEFKAHYAESVQDFAHECIRFRQAVEAISRELTGTRPLIEDQNADDEFVLSEARFRLQSLDSAISQEYVVSNGSLKSRTVSSSLLASFA